MCIRDRRRVHGNIKYQISKTYISYISWTMENKVISVIEGYVTANFATNAYTPERFDAFVNDVVAYAKRENLILTSKDFVPAVFNVVGKGIADDATKAPAFLAFGQELTDNIMEKFFEPKPKTCDALFFPSPENEKKLIAYLKSAKKTLDVCVFTITNNNLANALVDLHKRGVKVRVITDDQCANAQGSDIAFFAEKGIEVLLDSRADAHMHNKFAIVDNRLLLNGSFNWTTTAVSANQENITIVENKTLIKLYNAEFERLWVLFKKNRVQGLSCCILVFLVATPTPLRLNSSYFSYTRFQ
eukprot:TRINITY_DN965_c0_g1_i1.p1 TRINITY_DN965_c0_g1~~TRINITY_DN965_c0_g1_i1.p1  ORF type:complete len:301 (+),score=119.88 TRINITY_DN965_c0_g1_i1:70-972(+)